MSLKINDFATLGPIPNLSLDENLKRLSDETKENLCRENLLLRIPVVELGYGFLKILDFKIK